MTEIKQKALALVNAACNSDFKSLGRTYRHNMLDALLLAIEQHEAFRREVSDAVQKHFMWACNQDVPVAFHRFIIPKPVDPLVEAVTELSEVGGFDSLPAYADLLRKAMKARGWEWRKIEDGQ